MKSRENFCINPVHRRVQDRLSGSTTLTSKVQSTEMSLSRRDKQIFMLISPLDDLGNRGHRNDLIRFGVKEPTRESVELMSKVKGGIFHES